MKSNELNQIMPTDDETIVLGLLLGRIGDELCSMAMVCRDVENALGIVVSKPKKPIDQSIIAIQGLDKLRQTLEDLTRLSGVIACNNALSTIEMRSTRIRQSVVLTGLAERLTSSKTTQFGDNSDEPYVIWV